MEEYVTLMLVNGDELIAELEHESESAYVLVNPVITVVVNDTLMIKHYSTLSESSTFIISKKHVIFCNPLSTRLTEKYLGFLNHDTEVSSPEFLVESKTIN